MRFKQFLNESDETESALEQIRKECAPYLRAAKGGLLYRGIDASKINLFTPHPTDRPPRDSGFDKSFNFIFNTGCDLAFGVQNIRRHSVFATGSHNIASNYGSNTAIIFPAGDIKFVSSFQIEDSFNQSSVIQDTVKQALLSHGVNADEIPVFRTGKGFADLNKILGGAKNAARLWTADNSVEMAQKTAAAFGLENNAFMVALKTSIKESFDDLYFDSSSLDKAIASHNEILFYETVGYYSISVSSLISDEVYDKFYNDDDMNDLVMTALGKYYG